MPEKMVLFLRKSFRFLVFTAIAFVVFYLAAGKRLFQNKPGNDSGYFSLFHEAVGLVKKHYVEKTDPEVLYDGAFRALVSGLDPYSSYLDDRESHLHGLYQNGDICTAGLAGVGENRWFAVTDISPDSPADRAGLKSGDRIRAVDGTRLYSLSHWEMLFSLVSENPVKMQLSVEREGSFQNRLFTLESRCCLPESRILDVGGNTRLLELRRFDRQGFQMAGKFVDNGTKDSKWIIDLRMYTGGDFDSFLGITGLFVNRRVSLSVETRDRQSHFFAGKPGVLSGHPCVFVISGSTILYAELLAQLLKSSGARLVGRETPGFTPRLSQILLDGGGSVLFTEGIYKIDGRVTLGSGVQPTLEIDTGDWQRLIEKCKALLENG